MAPTRITLSRAKGFNLQEASMALNGLPAVVVGRQRNNGKWGNPYRIGDDIPPIGPVKGGLVKDAADAVARYRQWIEMEAATKR